MSSFERDLLDDCSISFTDAADFYLGIKKQAAPVDPREEVEDAARKGVLAGITQSEKNILVDRDSRGERTGRAVGNVLGTVGGAAAGHKLLKGPTGALVGGALGYAAGGSAGKEVGRGRDIARHRKYASVKTAEGDPISPEAFQRAQLAVNAANSAIQRRYREEQASPKAWGRFGKGVGIGAGTGALLGGAAALASRSGNRLDDALLMVPVGLTAGAILGGGAGSLVNDYKARGAAWQEGKDYLAKYAPELKMASARMRFKLATMKLADGPMGDMGGAMSSPTAGQELQPVNYLQAEQLAQQAQQAQEGTFYRMRAQQAEQMAQAVQQQMAQTQQELQALQMQAEQTGQQVQQGMQEALAARDDALKQTQIAANLRLGMQKLRQQMLEVASQDPAEVAASELQGQAQAEQEAQMAAAQGGDPAAAGGAPAAPPAKAGKEVEEAGRAQDEAVMQTQQAEMAAGQPQPQGSPAPGAAPSPSGGASLDMMDPSGVMKQGAARMRRRLQGKTAAVSPRLLGLGIGAGLGAAAGGYGAYMERQQVGDLRQRVQAMEAQEQGGFRQAMQLAALKGRAAMAEAGEQNPGAHTAYGALTGAASGAALGSTLAGIGGNIARHLPPYGG